MTTDWYDNALCKGRPTEVWYPDGNPGCKSHGDKKWRLPAAVCVQCPVAVQCLDAAMREEEEHGATRYGMRGGMTPNERAELARGRSRGGKPVEQVCGTPAGARRHYRVKERLCEPCKQAESRQWQDRKRKRLQGAGTPRRKGVSGGVLSGASSRVRGATPYSEAPNGLASAGASNPQLDHYIERG